MKRPSLTISAAMAIVFAISLAIGWNLSPDVKNPKVVDGGEVRAVKNPERMRPSRSASGVAAKMNRIRNAESPLERLRASISLAMSLDPSEFGAWMEGDRFSSRNGPELSVFRMIIFERWTAEDPDGLIAWSVHNDYGQAGRALDAFAKNDPERLIAHFREHPNHAIELAQLKDVAKHHPALALERLRELHESGLTSEQDRRSREVLLELSKDSTAALEAGLASLPDSIREQAESVLIGRKLEKDFAGEIAKLFAHSQGSEIFRDNMSLLKGKTAEILAAIPDMPASWRSDMALNPWVLFRSGEGKEFLESDLSALGFSEKEAKRIRDTGLSYLAHSSPEFVLKNTTDSVENKSAIETSVSSLFRRGRDSNEKVRQLISEIPNAEVRAEAIAQWEDLVAGQDASKASSPTEWLQSLGGVEDASIKKQQVATQLRNLDEAKVAEYRAGFNGLSSEAKERAALSIAATAPNSRSLNPLHGDAILHLAKNPPTESLKLSESAAHYTMSIAQQDPVSASQWVGSLPEGNTRIWAAKNLAKYWNQYDPSAVSVWMKNLNDNERKEVSAYMESDGW